MNHTELSMKEYARNVGSQRRDLAWISTPLDSWEPNPFYTGPPQPHPEADIEDDRVAPAPASLDLPRASNCTCSAEQVNRVGCCCPAEGPF